jgi:rhodanese-related sulfurtransferase
MKKLLIVLLLSYTLFAKFSSITAEQLITMQKQGVPVIDIRTPQEWKARGIIPNAHPIMFFTPKGSADVPNFMFSLGSLIKTKDKPFIIYCAHANRTKRLGKWLDSLGFKRVYELQGGIENGWIKKGFKTVPYK